MDRNAGNGSKDYKRRDSFRGCGTTKVLLLLWCRKSGINIRHIWILSLSGMEDEAKFLAFETMSALTCSGIFLLVEWVMRELPVKC